MRNAQAVRDRVEKMAERCRAAGMNVTPQRRAVYKALLESEEHPTPEALYKRVRRQMPSLSLATIYKVLDALESVGLVRAVPVLSRKRRYDANDDVHHHLVCTACGDIKDYYSEEFDRLVPRQTLRGFRPQAVSVNITGLCARCRSRER